MKKMKYIIICLCIIFIITLTALICIKKNQKNEVLDDDDIDYNENDGISEETPSTCYLEKTEYSYIKSIDLIEKFFEYINTKNNEALYGILDSEYIEREKITKEKCVNLLSKLIPQSFYIKEIYTQEIGYQQIDIQENNYLKILVRNNGKESYIYAVIINDLETAAYNINIINEEQYNNYINGKIKIEKTSIELNEYNEIKYSDTYQGKICLIMYDDYINSIKNNVENSYYLLDKEYREKRFLDINEYKEYINTNKEKLFNMTITQFIKDEQDEYTEYICMDNSNNYLIFRVTDGINYTLLLDEYTVDINNAVEKYNKSDIQNKVALNINKFITAINDKNYNYSYSILADSFKQNKYPNINEFRKYIQNNFYEENTVTYNEFTQQGSNYVYKITLKDKNSGSFKDVTIVMKLKEDTKFEMSFSIN